MRKKSLLTFLLAGLLIFSGVLVGVAQEEPREGGTLNIPAPYGGSINTLDPAHSGRNQDCLVYRNIYENLVKIDQATLEIKPGVAKDWEVSEDNLTYTFHLRKGIKFHNDTEVTASDVEFTYERLLDPEEASSAQDLFKDVKGAEAFLNGEAEDVSGIKVIDDYTIKLTLKKINPTFLYNVAGGSNYNAAILPEEYVKEKGDQFGNDPVGCGPFKLENWNRGSSVTLTAYEDYYGEGPYVDELVFKIMEESPARVAAFKSQQLDFDIVYPSQYKQYKKNPAYDGLMVQTAELWTRCVVFNMNLKKFQDVRIRRAFNYAIPEKKIMENVLNGKAYEARGWLPSSSPAFNPDLESYGYNPEKAKKLMKEAGYTPENPLKMKINGVDHPAWGVPMVETIKPFLEKVGFKIEPVLLDGSTHYNRVINGDFEAFIWSLGGEVTSLDYLTSAFYSGTPPASGRFSRYSNPEFDKLIEKAKRETDPEKRYEILQKADKLIKEDAPVWFFNYNKAVAIHQPWVHGIHEAPQDMVYQDWSQVWVDEDSPRA